MKNGPVPIPPPGLLQAKKAAIHNAYNLLADLDNRVNAYFRLKAERRLSKLKSPVPALNTIYKALDAYPLGLYSANMVNYTRPMIRRADSILSDCLNVVDTGRINGYFTPGDYDKLAERLTLVCSLVDEVYLIESQRPNPGKKGTRPNARAATLETKAKAAQPTNQTLPGVDSPPAELPRPRPTAPPVPANDLGLLFMREQEIRAAIDEVQTAISTNDITDVARLCGVLESYPFRQSPETGMFMECIDWHIERARFWSYEILCKPFIRTLALPKICKGLEYALQMVEQLISLSICSE